MNGFVKISISRASVVPVENRVAWLGKHGVIAKRFEIRAVAELGVWELLSRISDDGEVEWRYALANRVGPAAYANKRIEEAIAERLREDPTDLSDFDATAILVAASEKAEEVKRIEAAKKAAKQRRIAEVATWVAETTNIFAPNIVRAASEGRDVRAAVRHTIIARIEEVIDSLDNFGRPAAAYDFETDKRTPSRAAYDIRDAIVAVEAELIEAAALPGATVTISDFGRGDVAEEDKKVWRSMIEITIAHPWVTEITKHVLTEPLNYQPAEEGDDD